MAKEIKLTSYSKTSGWAAKIGPETLAQVLCDLPKFSDERLIVGLDKADDAAVYKMNDEQAVIQTLDFFTPIVDDPYMFGQIAAANALSDVYAMGGQPIVALNIVGFPNCLDIKYLNQILKGGADKVKEAGALLVGGHSVEDDEPKYGLSVTGMVHPDKVLANSKCQVGDILILTKPIGSGILNTAIKADFLDKEHEDEVIRVMASLNKTAAEGMLKTTVNACTDVTGFGLIGHLVEMAEGSEVSLELDAKAVPLLPGVQDMAETGLVPAGAYTNKAYMEDKVLINGTIETYLEDVLYDPQTSGGLVISLPEESAEKLMAIYKDHLETDYAVIGRVVDKKDKCVIVNT